MATSTFKLTAAMKGCLIAKGRKAGKEWHDPMPCVKLFTPDA